MKHFINPLLIVVLLSFCFACNNLIDISDVIMQNEEVSEFRIISESEALTILNDFLERTERNMLPTRSGRKRQVVSLDVYYSESISTKSGTAPTDSIPSAYVVNFADSSGFAVLGANNHVAPIVAVTERGMINPNTMEIIGTVTPVGNEEDDEGINWDIFDWYCPEDDDYYTTGTTQIVTDLIKGHVDAWGNVYIAVPPPAPDLVQTVEPLLNVKWSQGSWNEPGVYNKYCTKKNGKCAFSGCSITALAMIMSYNEFPDVLYVNGIPIEWEKTKEKPYASWLSSEGKESVSLLFGLIFNKVTHLATSKGTLITPRQIELQMIDLGYTNVIRHCDKEFTADMKRITENNLRDNKPLFLSAIPRQEPLSGHSWVIDGMDFDTCYRMFHFNFGWGGLCNGYFSLGCLNPAKAVSYDDTSLDNMNSKHDYEYNSHFRLISYDVPETFYSINRSF